MINGYLDRIVLCLVIFLFSLSTLTYSTTYILRCNHKIRIDLELLGFF